MSRGVNKVTLIGNLGRDVETRSLPSGGMVANFSLGTNESWKDKNGEKQERCEWHNCTVFGKLAEVCSQWLSKGSQVYVEGSIRTEKWQDKEGNDRYTTKIMVRELQMLGGRREGGEPRESVQAQGAPQSQSASASTDFEDDIPFAAYDRGMIA